LSCQQILITFLMFEMSCW